MKLEAGQLIRLNRNKGTLKEGEIFNVIRISGYVKILRYNDGKIGKGERKHANLTLFKLLSEKGGFYV